MIDNPVVEPVVEPIVEPVVDPTVKPTETPKTRNELLREMSKEHGVDLFNAEGIKKFKEFTESQKTEQQKLQEQLTTLTTEKATWENEKLEYEAQLKAIELGIASDKVKDALKLADGNPDNLVEVLKRYPTFQGGKGITIGVQDPNNSSQPTGLSEAEKYMANDPKYAKYIKK